MPRSLADHCQHLPMLNSSIGNVDEPVNRSGIPAQSLDTASARASDEDTWKWRLEPCFDAQTGLNTPYPDTPYAVDLRGSELDPL